MGGEGVGGEEGAGIWQYASCTPNVDIQPMDPPEVGGGGEGGGGAGKGGGGGEGSGEASQRPTPPLKVPLFELHEAQYDWKPA